MKKKSLVILSTTAVLSMAIAGSIGAAVISASAASIDQSSGSGATGTTTVTYSVNDSWTVTIPDTIVVGGAGADVKAEDVKIENGNTLKVSVKSENNWHIKDENHDGLEYELKPDSGRGTALKDNDVVLETTAGEDKTETLNATLKNAEDSKYSTGGTTYEDQLTFTVTNEDPA